MPRHAYLEMKMYWIWILQTQFRDECGSFFYYFEERWNKGNWVFSRWGLAVLTVLVTAVWMKDVTDPKFNSWSIKLA